MPRRGPLNKGQQILILALPFTEPRALPHRDAALHPQTINQPCASAPLIATTPLGDSVTIVSNVHTPQMQFTSVLSP